jgi:hypothetical protein
VIGDAAVGASARSLRAGISTERRTFDAMLERVMDVERFLITRGLRLPVGGSLLATAREPPVERHPNQSIEAGGSLPPAVR